MSDEHCPRCGRPITVISTRKIGTVRKRYLGCRKQRGGCGYRPADNIRVMVTPTNETSEHQVG